VEASARLRDAGAECDSSLAAVGLPFVELTTDVTNIASQRVILANAGVLFEEFTKPESPGGAPGLRYRIRL
jgi:predicted acetyltransferase